MEDIPVIIPQNAADLEELEKLDNEGKLMHGWSYPDFSKKPTTQELKIINSPNHDKK